MTDSSNLVRLVYVSRLSRNCTPQQLKEIVEKSRRNNPAYQVTGGLCYSINGFLQCLEGPRDSVNEIFRRIVKDDRNEEVTLVAYEESEERLFSNWEMAYVRADEISAQILSRNKIEPKFEPFLLGREQSLGLLKDIVREKLEFVAKEKSKREKAG